MSLFHFSDWSDLVPEVGMSMLKWVYTDQVDFSRGDNFVLDLMRTANVYRLEDLVAKYGKLHIFKYFCDRYSEICAAYNTGKIIFLNLTHKRTTLSLFF